MNSLLIWPGGKGAIVSKILKYIPEHKHYIEVFFGAGSVFFAKLPLKFETINDINSDVVNLFRVLQDKKKFKEFERIINLTLYSRGIYKDSMKYKNQEMGSLERAISFFINIRMSFGGKSGWSYSIRDTDNRKRSGAISKWLNCIKRLPEIANRFKHTQIENDDFENIIKRYDDDSDCFIYCDPPYLHETRKDTKLYKHEMSKEDHLRLLKICVVSNSKIMLSGYNSDMYNDLLSNWKKKEFHVTTSMANTNIQDREERTEVIWMNYDLLGEFKQNHLFEDKG